MTWIQWVGAILLIGAIINGQFLLAVLVFIFFILFN